MPRGEFLLALARFKGSPLEAELRDLEGMSRVALKLGEGPGGS